MASGDCDELRSKLKVVDSPQDEETAVKSNVTILSSVYELLECPVCFNTMYPPIHQCPNGHPLCCNCKLVVHDKCPTCRHKLDNVRCLILEKVAASIELPCKYQKYGCLRVLPYCSKFEHESQCSFRPYNCPIPDSSCSILADIPSFVSHLKDYHKVPLNNATTFSFTYVKTTEREDTNNGPCQPVVISCFGQYFYLHFEAFQSGATPICIVFVQLIGGDEEAKNYSYSLEFEGNGRKTIWQGVPRSIRDSRRDLRDSLHGLIIPQKFFAGEESGDGKKLKLKVGGSIWKEKFLFDGKSGDGENLKLPMVESGETRNDWHSNLLKQVHSICQKIVAAFAVVIKVNFKTYRRNLRIQEFM